MEKKIEERIDLYCEIYEKAFEKASKANPENARYIANEILEQVARDLRSELISELQKGNNGYADNKTKPDEAEKKDKDGIKDQTGKPKENANPPTEKQIQALHKFGIKTISKNLGKKEAAEILNSLISFSREGNKEAVNQMVEELNAIGEVDR